MTDITELAQREIRKLGPQSATQPRLWRLRLFLFLNGNGLACS